jgi:hypothetical protein
MVDRVVLLFWLLFNKLPGNRRHTYAGFPKSGFRTAVEKTRLLDKSKKAIPVPKVGKRQSGMGWKGKKSSV